MKIVFAALAGLTISTTASAQDTRNDIVVEGRRLEETARAFVGAISAPPSRENQLGRFDSAVCPGVAGINARQGQFIVDRIAQRAMSLGLSAGAPGCLANVLVLFTDEPGELARAIVEEQRYLMANTGMTDNLNTRGSEALEAFVSDERPVRWWHVAQTVTGDGQVLRDVPARLWNGGNRAPHLYAQGVFLSGREATRNSRTTRQDFRNVVIIVDGPRAAAPRLDALADYLAMVALAQIDPAADTSAFTSILNLYGENGERPLRMTEWDESYLEGLYAAPRQAPNVRRQEGRIVHSMRQDIERRRQ
ncbi:MAG: hypothetical protein KF779_16945 [Hyphomonadaceae bacterium]|nr:hypothetical protein [Hyphomonadaceae bacterium]